METTLLSFPLRLAITMASPQAWDFIRIRIGNLYYNLDSHARTAEVTCECQCSGDNYAGLQSLTVPAMVTYKGETYRVTAIGHGAFAYCGSLKSVAIPRVLTTIGAYAFYCCRNLRAVALADGVTRIGDCAFAVCRSLASLTCLAVKPPLGEMLVFGCVDCEKVTMYVPKESVHDYAAVKPWQDFHICS